MPSIITSILTSTVGLLFNKARDKIAAKLKDGDITDAKIREIVVRELNDIKTKIDALSRTNLLSSYRFLTEGVDFLNACLNKSNEKITEAQDGCGETSKTPRVAESGILNAALELSHATGKLKINSDDDFETAKQRFRIAREKATDAFCNKALSTEDIILAAKLRVTSEILECLQTPETAVTGCLSFLRDFHCLPAIREMLSVYLNGGVKLLLNKAERVENVKSVMLINYVLFEFASSFNSKHSSPLAWPTIELSDRSFNPILNWGEVSTKKSMGEELIQSPQCEVLLLIIIYPHLSALNSRGDIVVKYGNETIKVIPKAGESFKVVKLPVLREPKVIERDIVGVAVDNNNNINVVKWIKTCTENGEVRILHVLYVLDEYYNVKHDCLLDFLDTTFSCSARVAINQNNDIIMIQSEDPHVYVCGNTGQLKHKFKRDSRYSYSLSITNKNEIIIPSDDNETVHVYTDKGDLKSLIKAPAGHVVMGVAFHDVSFEIIVLSYFIKQYSYFLLCYSDTGELKTSTFFCKCNKGLLDVTSHSRGPVAVVMEKKITYI